MLYWTANFSKTVTANGNGNLYPVEIYDGSQIIHQRDVHIQTTCH